MMINVNDIHLKRYIPDNKSVWDAFVTHAKNGLFLFYRDYMEYHAERFGDYSLMAYSGTQLIALLPANLKNNVLHSHQGLTFGGWVTDTSMKTATMLLLFEHLIAHLKAEGLKELMYKCIPHIYHSVPAEEDRYALFRNDAQLIECNVTTTIDYRQPLPFCARRKRGIAKAVKAGVSVSECSDYSTYFKILEGVLKEKFDTRPTHSLSELLTLREKFPKNIKLFAAYKDAAMLAGVIVYESTFVAHAQYIASTTEGRSYGALDMVFDHLIHHVCANKRYFDFGTSNERQGRELNEGLINQKEEFGGCAVTHAIYKMMIL